MQGTTRNIQQASLKLSSTISTTKNWWSTACHCQICIWTLAMFWVATTAIQAFLPASQWSKSKQNGLTGRQKFPKQVLHRWRVLQTICDCNDWSIHVPHSSHPQSLKQMHHKFTRSREDKGAVEANNEGDGDASGANNEEAMVEEAKVDGEEVVHLPGVKSCFIHAHHGKRSHHLCLWHLAELHDILQTSALIDLSKNVGIESGDQNQDSNDKRELSGKTKRSCKEAKQQEQFWNAMSSLLTGSWEQAKQEVVDKKRAKMKQCIAPACSTDNEQLKQVHLKMAQNKKDHPQVTHLFLALMGSNCLSLFWLFVFVTWTINPHWSQLFVFVPWIVNPCMLIVNPNCTYHIEPTVHCCHCVITANKPGASCAHLQWLHCARCLLGAVHQMATMFLFVFGKTHAESTMTCHCCVPHRAEAVSGNGLCHHCPCMEFHLLSLCVKQMLLNDIIGFTGWFETLVNATIVKTAHDHCKFALFLHGKARREWFAKCTPTID